MESATQPETTTTAAENGAANGERAARRDLRGPPAGRRLGDPRGGDRLARRRRRRRRPRARQPARLGGDRVRRPPALAREPARLDPRQPGPDRRPDAGGDRQGPRRRRARGLLLSSTRSTSGATRGRSSSPTRSISPHNPLLKAKRAKIVYRPFGVVGMISPWNFPVILSLGDAIPALLAGNAVVIKPSEITPLTLMEIVRAWREEVGAPGRARGRQRHGRDRRRADRRVRLHAVHRLGEDRQDRDEARGRDADPGQPRARRQGPDDRHPRRRPRARGQRDRLGRAAEHRPDLHLDRARLRRGADLRRVRRQAHREGRRPCARAPTATPTRPRSAR